MTYLKELAAGDLGFVLLGLALAAALGIVGPSRWESASDTPLCRSDRPSVSERAATRVAGKTPISAAGAPRAPACL